MWTASYDASSSLIKRIKGGASADVFLSADADWMDYGSKQHLIKDDTRINLLGNQLVLIAAKTSTLSSVDTCLTPRVSADTRRQATSVTPP